MEIKTIILLVVAAIFSLQASEKQPKVSCKYNNWFGVYGFKEHRPLAFDGIDTLEDMEKAIKNRELNSELEVLKVFNVAKITQQKYPTDRKYLKEQHYQALLTESRPDVFHDPAIPAKDLAIVKQALIATRINPNAVDIKQNDLDYFTATAKSSWYAYNNPYKARLGKHKPTITIGKDEKLNVHTAFHEATHLKEAHYDTEILMGKAIDTTRWFPLTTLAKQEICKSDTAQARALQKQLRRREETADLLPLIDNPHLARNALIKHNNNLICSLKDYKSQKFVHYPKFNVQRDAVKMLYYIDKIRALHFEKKYFKDERQFILTQPF